MDFQGQKAIYLQIADYVCEQILLKQWQEQAKIPSVRELAVNLAVNPNTVMRTYSFLEENNIIETRRGVGYFVVTDAYRRALEWKREEFLQQDLPYFFKTLDLLQIDQQQLISLYKARRSHES